MMHHHAPVKLDVAMFGCLLDITAREGGREKGRKEGRKGREGGGKGG